MNTKFSTLKDAVRREMRDEYRVVKGADTCNNSNRMEDTYAKKPCLGAQRSTRFLRDI